MTYPQLTPAEVEYERGVRDGRRQALDELAAIADKNAATTAQSEWAEFLACYMECRKAQGYDNGNRD